MNGVKTVLCGFCVLVALGVASPAVAQIPVTDAGSIAEQIAEHLETLARWKAQYDQMVSQITSLKAQYDSFTGVRNLGDIFNNPYLRSYLPSEWQRVYDDVKALGYGGLSGTGATVYSEYHAFDSCAFYVLEEERKACEARAVKAALDKGYALDAFMMASKRILQLDKLMGAIKETRDPKGSAELQSRISIEQAMIGAEQTKMELYQSVAEAEDRAQEQQARELESRTWAKRGFAQAKPRTFGR